MSYLKKIEYEIVPKESFTVIRNCSGCGRKSYFKNTKRFRVNANGNKLDVWLIYQCEKCRHTLNLAIYERQRVSSVPEKEYQCFLRNDEELAERYGIDLRLFAKNRAEIDFVRTDYQYVKLSEETETDVYEGQAAIIIHNPYGLKIRPEKQAAEILKVSGSQAKKMIENEKIQVKYTSVKSISILVDRDLGELGE